MNLQNKYWEKLYLRFSKQIFSEYWQIISLSCDRSSNSVDIGRFWMDCLSAMDASIKTRAHKTEESLQNFSRCIYFSFEEIRNNARSRQTEIESYLKHNLSMTNRLWEDRKRFLTSERGAWVERYCFGILRLWYVDMRSVWLSEGHLSLHPTVAGYIA